MIDVTRSRIVAVTAPATLAMVEVFHPHPHDLLNLDLTRWMSVVAADFFPLTVRIATAGIQGCDAGSPDRGRF